MRSGVITNEEGKAVFIPVVGQTFKEFLKQELMARCERNEYYSLRSFAKNLGIDSSSLSQLISGKRKMSSRMIGRLGNKLHLQKEQIQVFIQAQEETKYGEFHAADTRDPEVFEYMSDWHNFAVTELLRLKNGPKTEKEIQKVLRVNNEEMAVIKKRCFRLGLIQIDPQGTWTDTAPKRISIEGSLKSGGPNPNPHFQQSLLSSAKKELMREDKPFYQGAHWHGHIFPMNKNEVEGLRKVIRDFARSLVKDAQKNQNQDTVYSLVVDLFPLTESIE